MVTDYERREVAERPCVEGEPVEVFAREGTFTIYDAEGACVGRVCTDVGRAMIGAAFWQRVSAGFVDHHGVMSAVGDLLDEMGGAKDDERCPLTVGEARDFARRVAEAMGEECDV